MDDNHPLIAIHQAKAFSKCRSSLINSDKLRTDLKCSGLVQIALPLGECAKLVRMRTKAAS
jgi:hypothetical protein